MSTVIRRSWFQRMATRASWWAGRPKTFLFALSAVLLWAVTGPVFHYSDTWQLVINTSTTIITFLMVFLVQNTQNRDGEAVQIKLSELIRALRGAHNALLDLEELDETQLEEIRRTYGKAAAKARSNAKRGREDTQVAALELPGDAPRAARSGTARRRRSRGPRKPRGRPHKEP